MKVQFLPEARAELMEAVAYYEGELSGACTYSGAGAQQFSFPDSHCLLL